MYFQGPNQLEPDTSKRYSI